MDDYIRIFSQTAIGDIIEKDQFISIKKTESVEKLLELLYQHSLTCLPVVEGGEDGERTRVVGFVDTNDVLQLMSKMFDTIDKNSTDENIRLFSIAFLYSNVHNIMNVSKKDQFQVVLEEQSLLEVLRLYSTGIHRVALLSVFSEIENIVSQSQVIKFLSKNLSVLGETLEFATIRELLPFLTPKESLITTKASTMTIDSFKLMNLHKISAVPVLNDNDNKIIGNLSINDLYGLKESTIKLLLEPTLSFLNINQNNQHNNNDLLQNKNKPDHPVVLTLNDTFKDAIERVSQNKIHRVWIVDDNNVPISLISLTDICKLIVESPYCDIIEEEKSKERYQQQHEDNSNNSNNNSNNNKARE
ncbi:hypothetical protein DICPUDRAFT_96258 [Dictyostelium purpureum]|uniref:CBS domain-containing protein n=1 Tax=Dictyostelium purpureum TaxID=5786 RepID=F0Z6L4_DICPU|nr:uncharacterized protein DICPUDRAFT_96258 [Dictyostelium purpureum]EGC40456.1 hypothetical protein DICPUDRAFT_96258 [Dictyostelium purpureum]|eukprot:XP_003283003.1 hypothetical protein DICPUDRAFT_96258 [Dictyostelium purpureum]